MPSKKSNLTVSYTKQYHFIIPNEWEVKDIEIHQGVLYYKDKATDCDYAETEDWECYPDKIEKEARDSDADTDSEEEESEEE
jgi:hypothetical protein